MLESGHSIADYQIVTPLTENPLFATYQVTGYEIASAKLLLIAPGQIEGKKARQRFIDQSQLLLGQSFPGLCSLLAADSNDDYSYCLYPFPGGGALEGVLSEKRTVRQSLEIVRAVAVHLSSAYAAGLWHGSVSPATIFLDGNDVCLDLFAVASLLPLDFNSGIDPCYGSPELVRGEPLSAGSDLYSLGIVLYRLLAGEVPFRGEDPFATAMKHVQEQPAGLPAALAVVQPLVDNLLQPLTAERWSAERLVAEIDRYLLLPELESLEVPVAAPVEVAEMPSDEVAAAPSQIEKLMDDIDMAARIEQRLNARADALQEGAALTPDAKRASTDRMTAFSQQSYRKKKDMNHNRYQQKVGMGRYLLLIAVGIAAGVIIYLTLFGQETGMQKKASATPEALLTGLESGSQLLEAGDIEAAEKTFSGLIGGFPLYPQPYNNLAAIYARQGDLERSRTILERAMATDEAYATVYRNLGTVYSEMARDSYGRALQLEKGQQAVSLQVFGGTQLVAVNAAASENAAIMATKGAAEEIDAQQAVDVAVQKSPAKEPVADTQPEEPLSSTKDTEVETAASVIEVNVAEPEPVVDVSVATDTDTAREFLLRWATAWSAQDVPAYLSFYAEKFVPSAGISRKDWALQREVRLLRPESIDVTLEDFSVVRQADDSLQMEVTQEYKSDRYADRTRKRFDLVKTGDSWQIVRERSLGRAR